MNIPRFTAAASLYTTTNHYRASSLDFGEIQSAGTIYPSYFPGSDTRNNCRECEADCGLDYVKCTGSALAGAIAGCAISSIFTLGAGCAVAGAGLAAAYALCNVYLGGCLLHCQLTTCCPKRCGAFDPTSAGSGCCDEGENCVDESDPNAREGCCPSGHPVCGGKCCPFPDSTCCGDTCCPSGSTCLDGVCCPAGTLTICNGKCCSGGCDINNNCCQPPAHLCAGKCCVGVCCNNNCLDPSMTCIDESPCPKARACHNICCPRGQYCREGACAPCPPGKEPVACGGGGPPNACCPPNTGCCNGRCCPGPTLPGHSTECCQPKGGVRDLPPFDNDEFGCHHAFACIQ
jgi:hypothetical protein